MYLENQSLPAPYETDSRTFQSFCAGFTSHSTENIKIFNHQCVKFFSGHPTFSSGKDGTLPSSRDKSCPWVHSAFLLCLPQDFAPATNPVTLIFSRTHVLSVSSCVQDSCILRKDSLTDWLWLSFLPHLCKSSPVLSTIPHTHLEVQSVSRCFLTTIKQPINFGVCAGAMAPGK